MPLMPAHHVKIPFCAAKGFQTVVHPQTGSEDVILHVLTGVKRLDSDNTAVSGTLSLDNYITPVLHCFHSLSVILLKSK